MSKLELRRRLKIGSIGVTGTPGTGKKSMAPLVAKKLGLEAASLNELAERFRAVLQPSGEVDTAAFRRRLARRTPRPSLYYGHLLPYVFDGDDLAGVVVLRCEPGVLRGRLLERGYSGQKLVENVEAELIGVISSDAYDVFGRGKTFEVDTTRTSPAEASTEALDLLRGTRAPGRIDWTVTYDSGAKLRLLLSAE